MKPNQTIKQIDIGLIDIVPRKPGYEHPLGAFQSGVPNSSVDYSVVVTPRSYSSALRYELLAGEEDLRARRRMRQRQVAALIVSNVERRSAPPENAPSRLRYRRPELLRDIESLQRLGWGNEQIAAKLELSEAEFVAADALIKAGALSQIGAAQLKLLRKRHRNEVRGLDPQNASRKLRQSFDVEQSNVRARIANRQAETRKRLSPLIADDEARAGQRPQGARIGDFYEHRLSEKWRLIDKAEAVSKRLAEAISLLKGLLTDENLVLLLRAEGIADLPNQIATRLKVCTMGVVPNVDNIDSGGAGREFEVAEYRRRTPNLGRVCIEAVAVLMPLPVSRTSGDLLKRLMPQRQIEVAKAMVEANRYDANYVRSLVSASAEADLISTGAKSHGRGGQRPARVVDADDAVRMNERFASAVVSIGPDHLDLTLLSCYVRTLLKNPAFARHIQRFHQHAVPELERLQMLN